MRSVKTKEENIGWLSERQMHLILEQYLVSRGWHIAALTNSQKRVDIEAKSGDRTWIIEVRGMKSQASEPLNSFISVLGEILQRMDDREIKYSIALPDTLPFYRLWKRLPAVAKHRTGITALFVNPLGFIKEEIN